MTINTHTTPSADVCRQATWQAEGIQMAQFYREHSLHHQIGMALRVCKSAHLPIFDCMSDIILPTVTGLGLVGTGCCRPVTP
jgi:hypothetical protein